MPRHPTPPAPPTLKSRYARWPQKVKGTNYPSVLLLAQLEKKPLSMAEITALKLHNYIGALIWPGKLAVFDRENGSTYALTKAGKAYLQKLREADFLP